MNKLKFDPKYHKYTIGNILLKSVTTFLSQFKKPFDVEYWSAHVAKKRGISKGEVKQEWKEKANKSSAMGTNVHKYAEDKAAIKQGKKITLPKPKDIKETRRMSAVDKFFDDHPHLKPVAAEEQLYNIEYRLAGTLDYRVVCDEGYYYLIDWKTNKVIDTENKYREKMLYPLEHLDNCHLMEYSLQLSLYKYMIEKSLGIKIKGMYLIHLQAKGYKQYECEYMEDEIKLILEIRKQEIKNM